MLTVTAITPVYEVMTSSPVSVHANTTIGMLLNLFDRHDYNAFPVTDGTKELIGIVTKLDLLRALRPSPDMQLPPSAEVLKKTVGEIMRTGVVSLEGDDPIGVAADLMIETQLRSIPVVHRAGGRPELVGMVSRGDIIRGLHFAIHDEQ